MEEIKKETKTQNIKNINANKRMIDTFEDDFWIIHKEAGPKSKK